MAGKKGRSGRPPNAPKVLPALTKKAILKAVRELTKEYGMTPEKAMLSLLYKDGVQDAVKASVWKSYLEAMTSRVTEQNVTVKDSGGLVIGLPEPYEETEE